MAGKMANNGADEVKNSVLNIPEELLTPGMRQYQQVKLAHPDCLVMLRMGDFFEMFYEDAITASQELEITLTSRGKGDKKAPLAGVPFHALDAYLGRLVKKGYKVALVEQLEDPKQAKGLVKRGLVRIVTPGTVIESSMLTESENNYIMSLSCRDDSYAVAGCDISTGEFFTSSAEGISGLINEIARYAPSEMVLPESIKMHKELLQKIAALGIFTTFCDDYSFSQGKAREALLSHFRCTTLDAFGLEHMPENVAVAGALLQYMIATQKNTLQHIRKISLQSGHQEMLLDSTAIRNLELLQNLRDSTSRGSLLGVLDQTVTAMGARLLRQWMKKPLQRRDLLQQRLDAVAELNKSVIAREELRGLLEGVYDLERLVSRVNYGNATPRDLLALRNSLAQLPLLARGLSLSISPLLQKIAQFPDLGRIAVLLQRALRDDAPLTVREGGMIRKGFHLELDELHSIQHNSRRYLQELEEKEKQKTGISTLKIGYTRVFGYFIEVTRKNVSLVPAHYIRKQTTANAERYITEELKLEEEKILGAEEKSRELEYRLFQELLATVSAVTSEIQESASHIAVLDVLLSFARVAMEQRYVMPELTEEPLIQISNGRHPVVETMQPHFVANDVVLDAGDLMVITGPNMAGKSTVMRQVALIVLMAQMGSFVPAEKAVLGVVDRIFTRVGAYDDVSSGQSTFMVEMSETAAILNGATSRSLIILDEIGRGTSTFDGVSIAWSVAEYIHNTIKARTLFATHYHVMNKLAEKLSRAKNYNIAVHEKDGAVVFLHKLVAGGTDQSYGIHVAELAGLPVEVIARAREIQSALERDDEMMQKLKVKKISEQMRLGEF